MNSWPGLHDRNSVLSRTVWRALRTVAGSTFLQLFWEYTCAESRKTSKSQFSKSRKRKWSKGSLEYSGTIFRHHKVFAVAWRMSVCDVGREEGWHIHFMGAGRFTKSPQSLTLKSDWKSSQHSESKRRLKTPGRGCGWVHKGAWERAWRKNCNVRRSAWPLRGRRMLN